MKKYISIILLGLSIPNFYAQQITIDEPLRLSVDNITGTARFRAMSGAFGALGGDLSAITQNPAGSVFFNNNFIDFYIKIQYVAYSAVYDHYNFNINLYAKYKNNFK